MENSDKHSIIQKMIAIHKKHNDLMIKYLNGEVNVKYFREEQEELYEDLRYADVELIEQQEDIYCPNPF
jgi:hypothetical protein